MKLNELKPNPGSRRERKRVGRGPGGTDKTAGRGHKGQKSRSGAGKGQFFEGGRSTLLSRLPKRGFNHVGIEYALINLRDLERFEPGSTLDFADFIVGGLIKNGNKPIKLLASGEVTGAYTLHVDAASKSAIAKIEAAGGKVILTEEEQGSEEAKEA
ncbi:large subunit ribosomal protein L15 [Deinobacterium chartae]|uniref:Large ribosomal subunit protein uL15 n=1 Tax=Deinobacterium chartae TaxID=521158 RepID=A0A841I4A5_9DEIO|nr:50S ribosomal protein L15 [Deinobacterium chartae]MBB6100163.1 large subunit ribosomal protein L15 [Deinobacterium chartae]